MWTILFIWTRVLTHNKYVEIKQFSKVEIKQTIISSLILFIKFLVYEWDQQHLHGSRVVCKFVYTTKSPINLISNQMLCISIMRIRIQTFLKLWNRKRQKKKCMPVYFVDELKLLRMCAFSVSKCTVRFTIKHIGNKNWTPWKRIWILKWDSVNILK